MMQSRWFRVTGILSLVGALTGVVGCGAEGGSTDASSNEGVAEAPLVQEPSKGAQAEETAKGKGPREGRGGKHGGRHGGWAHGPERLLGAALHKLDLSDAQKTSIKGALDDLHKDAKEGPKDPGVFKALAQGVRAGKIDRTAVDAKLADTDRDGKEHQARVASALNTLHATLTKEQRRELVDALAAKMDKHGPEGEHGPRGDRDGAWDRGPKGERGEKGGFGMKGGPMGHLLRDLNLSDEQRAQVDKALEASRPSDADRDAMKQKFEAMRAEMRTRMEAFAADSFDANAFLSAMPAGKERGPKAHLEGMVSWLAAVVPVLDEAQRNTLADRLEKGPGAGHGPHGSKRGGTRGGTRL